MVQLKEPFKASDHEPASMGFDLLPDGDYDACITSSESMIAKSSGNEYVKLTFQILEGQYKNRLIWHNLILTAGSIEGQKKVDGIFTSLCNACGIDAVEDTSELHDIPITIKVKIEKGKDGYDDSNRITAFKPLKKAVSSGVAHIKEKLKGHVKGSKKPAPVSIENDNLPDWSKQA